MMKSYIPLSGLVVLVCSLFGAALADQAVALLTHDNYTSFLEDNNLVLVEFTAPWCGHCRKMGKEYENAAGTLQRMNYPGRLAIIDASLQENHGIVDMMKVEGYPTFLLYRMGSHVLSYGGLRTESHFVEYMLQKNAPLITQAKKLEDMLQYFSSHFDPLKEDTGEHDKRLAHYFFIGMMSSRGDNGPGYDEKIEAYQKMMEEVAARNENTNIHFLFTENEAIMDYFLVPEDSFHSFSIASVMLTSSSGDSLSTTPGNSILRADITTSEQLFNFIMTSCSETMVPFQSNNLHLLRNIYAPKNQVLVFCDNSDTQGQSCLETVQKVAPAYRGTFLFVSISHQELHLYHTFGIKIGTPHPQIVILNLSNEVDLKKYVLDSNMYALMSSQDPHQRNVEDSEQVKEKAVSVILTEEILHQFLKMYLSDELLPFYRSEEMTPASLDGSSAEQNSNDDNSGDTPHSLSAEGPEGEETEEEEAMRLDLLPVHITSATLKDKVMESTETVLLFITAPWCGHCKSLAPVIRSLAKLLHQRKRKYTQATTAISSLAGLAVSDDIVVTKVDSGAKDDVVVGQIDGSVNDLHSLGSVDVNGFPTIVFVRYVDGEKEAIEYTGERSVKDILQYIHKNGVPLTSTTSTTAAPEDEVSLAIGKHDEL